MEGYPWVADENIIGNISRNALVAEIGKPAAHSAMGRLRYIGRLPQRLIPSYEHLEVGDIILSGYPRKEDGRYKWHPVHQSQASNGHPADACHWVHAMLYVGELHVIESNKPTSIRTGIALAPLTRDAHNREFLVLRYKDPDFAKRRDAINRYALMSPYLSPRDYDIWGAIQSHFKWRPNGAKHSDRIFCSEFILECFAIMGPFLVEDWLRVTEHENEFFLPAHLATDPRFDKFPMKYFSLE
ncbi:hypothetical protein ACQR1I_04695 [Bradyrhizobium sp. HKCCYLS2038]|uniref:hypothetical protein n=1 Tax=unclassified Bradyrhizobium TaxID=2631580 RepID=UPI003EBE162E